MAMDSTKVIIITGAAGYIGGQIALLLKDQGYEVIGIDQQPCPVFLTSVFDEFYQDDFASSISLTGTRCHCPLCWYQSGWTQHQESARLLQQQCGQNIKVVRFDRARFAYH